MKPNPRRLPRLPNLPQPAGAADAELLARWACHRDEVAFELLVRRHARLVLAACRRLLADANDADDAFQAAFLVLARKAGSVSRGEVLGAWLHRVACRAALRIRTDRAKRTNCRDAVAVEEVPAPTPADPAWAELCRVLDEEVAKLPERHRVVFVLCCLEGKTGEEAARLLGCPAGTVSSRLTRARERLRDRLALRGFAPAVAAAALAVLPGDSGAAFVSHTLLDSVLRAAMPFSAGWPHAAGVPSRPAAVAEGVVNAMFLKNLRMIPLLLLAGAVAAGAVMAGSGQDSQPVAEANQQPTAKPTAQDKKPADGPITVKLVKPQPGGLERVVRAGCTAEPMQQAQISAPTAGTLRVVKADIGDHVKLGAVLAEIEAPALRFDSLQAMAAVVQANSLLTEAHAHAAVGKAEMEAARGVIRQREAEVAGAKADLVLRQKNYERAKAGVDRGAVDRTTLAQYEVEFKSAEGKVEAALVGIENAKADVAVKEAKLTQLQAAVGTAKANVETAKVGMDKARSAYDAQIIRAPFDGVIARRNCDPGNLVRPGESADTPLFTLVRVDVIRVVVDVPEREIGLVKKDAEAEMTFEGLPDKRVTGKVGRIGYVVDPTNHGVRVEVFFPNPKGEIRPGMYGKVRMKLSDGPADAVRVPETAVFANPNRKPGEPDGAVYVYRDGKARLTPVRMSYRANGVTEIDAGLTANDLVVTNPKKLQDKTEVPVEVEKPAPGK